MSTKLKQYETTTKIDDVFVRRTDVYDSVNRQQYVFGFETNKNLGVAWSRRNASTVWAARERHGELQQTEFDKAEHGGDKKRAFKAAMSWVVEDHRNATNTTGKI